jgi:hypothetical protein
MAKAGRTRYLRQITLSVLRYYIEFEDGVIPGGVFEPRVLDYRIDVERIITAELDPAEHRMLMLVHQAGLTNVDAAAQCGIQVKRPDKYLSAIETRLGRVFERRNMLDLLGYLR